jgi:hypothetical protein
MPEAVKYKGLIVLNPKNYSTIYRFLNIVLYLVLLLKYQFKNRIIGHLGSIIA